VIGTADPVSGASAITAASVSDDVLSTAPDHLGCWLRTAAEDWHRATGEPLESVEIFGTARAEPSAAASPARAENAFAIPARLISRPRIAHATRLPFVHVLRCYTPTPPQRL